jgi:hypothetical protein
MTTIRDGNANVDGLKLFNLEAGPVEGPKLLLIHGFPMLPGFPVLHGFRSAGGMFHEPIPALSDARAIQSPFRYGVSCTFAEQAEAIERFTRVPGRRWLLKRHLRPRAAGLYLQRLQGGHDR